MSSPWKDPWVKTARPGFSRSMGSAARRRARARARLAEKTAPSTAGGLATALDILTDALALVGLDGKVDASVVQHILGLPSITDVKLVRLPGAAKVTAAG